VTDTGTISQAQKDYAKFIAAQRKECASTFATKRKQFRTGREAIGALGEIVFADHYLLEHPGVTLLGSANTTHYLATWTYTKLKPRIALTTS
jgi:hypothetical protein